MIRSFIKLFYCLFNHKRFDSAQNKTVVLNRKMNLGKDHSCCLRQLGMQSLFKVSLIIRSRLPRQEHLILIESILWMLIEKILRLKWRDKWQMIRIIWFLSRITLFDKVPKDPSYQIFWLNTLQGFPNESVLHHLQSNTLLILKSRIILH